MAEAKENLTLSEATHWFEYMEKRGMLNLGMRMERGFALLASMYANAHGQKTALIDFMPTLKKAEEEQVASIESVFGMLKSMSKQKRK